jgi:cytochrome c-type biogenesis protein CcmH
MLFWSIAIAATAIVCAAIYAASSRVVNATPTVTDSANSHFKLLLAGIYADVASGKLSEADAEAARAELAREIVRQKGDNSALTESKLRFDRPQLLVGLAGVAAVTFAIYAALGSPNLPSQPLASRDLTPPQSITLDDAILRIEEALVANPDDVRGWEVIAPAYMELQRFADAENAYRRAIALTEPTPGLDLKLAEALLFQQQPEKAAEAVTLLRGVAEADPTQVMARLYLASELTRSGQYDEAITIWNEAIALGKGDELWMQAAREGLATAMNDGVAPEGAAQDEMIAGMVSQLSERLAKDGGTVEEWTQLIRAHLVLNDKASAQAAYDDAVKAYPQAFDRGEMDTLALSAGLVLNGDAP